MFEKQSKKPASLKNRLQESSSSVRESNPISQQIPNASNNPNPSSNNSLSSKCKVDIVDSILKNSTQKKSFEHLMQEEQLQKEIIEKRKKIIGNVNLLEQNIDDLYDWKTLFNNSRPISHYTKLDHDKEKTKKKHEKEDNDFHFPCALIDAPTEKFSNFIPKNNNTVHFNATRPKSVFCPREKNETFYLSKDFSDYYLEDFKNFRKKMPLLQAKKRCESAKLRKIIKQIHKTNESSEYILKNKYSKVNKDKSNSIKISNRDLNLAISKKNAEPLLNSIYQQMNNNNPQRISNPYINQNKSIEENSLENNAKVNTSFNNSSWYMSNKISGSNQCIKVSTYDVNDPDLGIFKNLESLKDNSMISNENDKPQTSRNILPSKPTFLSSKRPLSSSSSRTIISNRIMSSKLQKKSSIKKPQDKINQVTNTSLNIMSNNSMKQQTKIISKQALSSSSSAENINNLTNDNTISSVCEYIPVKAMPTRTNSKIQNFTYGKIDKQMKERQLNMSNCDKNKGNNFNRGISAIYNTKELKRPMSSINIHPKKIEENIEYERKITKVPTQKVNMIYFNDYIDTVFQKEIIIYTKEKNNILPVNYFNKISARRYNIPSNKNSFNDYYNMYNSSSRKQSLSGSTSTRRVMSAKVGTH